MRKKILIIGSSGSGKTHVSAELRRRGINAVDADLIDGLSDWFDGKGDKVEYPKDASKEFLDNHKFLWDRKFLKEFLDKQKEIYLFGLSGNIFSVIDLFDRVYFLKVDSQILAKNLRHASRENPMGRTDYQLENALRYAEEIERKANELGIKFIDATDKSSEQIFSEISID
ncbi:MAG: AAA family ATPase [bacterium]